MTVSSPNVIEIKLDRLIDDMRLLRSQMIGPLIDALVLLPNCQSVSSTAVVSSRI
jgi:hypothetical protein